MKVSRTRAARLQRSLRCTRLKSYLGLALIGFVTLSATGVMPGCASSSKKSPSASAKGDDDDDEGSSADSGKSGEAKQELDAKKSTHGATKSVITTLGAQSAIQGSVGTQALSDAILEVEELVRKEPDDVPMVVTFLALLRMAGNGSDIQKNLAVAAGSKGAKNPWFLLELAYGALSRREWARAEYLLGKVGRFSAGDTLVKAAASHAWGVRYLVDRKEAQGIYEMTKAGKANYLPALLTLGYLALRSGDYIGAERNFRIASASAGENLNAKMGLAISLRVRGKADEAEPLLAQVYKVRPNDRRVAWNYAVALADMPSRRKDAIDLLTKYFQLPGSLGDVDGRANALLQKLQAPPAKPAAPAAKAAAPAAGAGGGDAGAGAGKADAPKGGAGKPEAAAKPGNPTAPAK